MSEPERPPPRRPPLVTVSAPERKSRAPRRTLPQEVEPPSLVVEREPVVRTTAPVIQSEEIHGLADPTRRRPTRTPATVKVDDFVPAGPSAQLAEAPPLASFRWGGLIIGLVGVSDKLAHQIWPLGVILVVLAIYSTVTTFRPIPYRDDRQNRALVGFDALIHLAAVMMSGNWDSPFAFTLIPSTLLAGFASGPIYACQLMGTCAGIVSMRYLTAVGIGAGWRTSAAWCGVLALVALTSGLSRRVSVASAKQQRLAIDRVAQLAEANGLLFSLQRVAQTLPASLDLDDVLDSTLKSLRVMIDADTITVVLYSEADQTWEPVRTIGYKTENIYTPDSLPPPVQQAIAEPGTLWLEDLVSQGPGVAQGMRCGLYASLKTRGSLIGVVSLEGRRPGKFNEQHVKLLDGFIEPFGIAIDNARLFRRLRSIGADEERARIARELHDRVGNALAMVGFEVDRVSSQANRGMPVTEDLSGLREQIKGVVGDVREALYDLRTDVSEERDLTSTLEGFLIRVRTRSSHITVDDVLDATSRLPILQERELWQIARESITNAERHSECTRLSVEWRCHDQGAELAIRDNGKGFKKGAGRQDSYGLVGMRERAASMGATFELSSELGVGTSVIVRLVNETRGGQS